ncbi:hypothetical protein FPSE5266_08021 [Fusarium pseudograminearum]|nr:hypothetical protein FPSE5266_08021 [Fusarium pseudograminearum]
MQKLNDFSDRYNAGGDIGVLTSASPLLPLNWHYLVESAHTCQEEVLEGIHIPGDRALKWISLPVFEATITVLAVQIITFPVRNLERTSPDAVNPIERYETDEDELWLEEALKTYGKFVDGSKDTQVLECYNLCEDLASKAENTLETFFNDPTSDVPDTENNGLVEEADPELYMDS